MTAPGPAGPPPARDQPSEGTFLLALDALAEAIAAAAPPLTGEQRDKLRQIFAGADRTERGAA